MGKPAYVIDYKAKWRPKGVCLGWSLPAISLNPEVLITLLRAQIKKPAKAGFFHLASPRGFEPLLPP
jgi:hypothetical protein